MPSTTKSKGIRKEMAHYRRKGNANQSLLKSYTTKEEVTEISAPAAPGRSSFYGGPSGVLGSVNVPLAGAKVLQHPAWMTKSVDRLNPRMHSADALIQQASQYGGGVVLSSTSQAGFKGFSQAGGASASRRVALDRDRRRVRRRVKAGGRGEQPQSQSTLEQQAWDTTVHDSAAVFDKVCGSERFGISHAVSISNARQRNANTKRRFKLTHAEQLLEKQLPRYVGRGDYATACAVLTSAEGCCRDSKKSAGPRMRAQAAATTRDIHALRARLEGDHCVNEAAATLELRDYDGYAEGMRDAARHYADYFGSEYARRLRLRFHEAARLERSERSEEQGEEQGGGGQGGGLAGGAGGSPTGVTSVSGGWSSGLSQPSVSGLAPAATVADAAATAGSVSGWFEEAPSAAQGTAGDALAPWKHEFLCDRERLARVTKVDMNAKAAGHAAEHLRGSLEEAQNALRQFDHGAGLEHYALAARSLVQCQSHVESHEQRRKENREREVAAREGLERLQEEAERLQREEEREAQRQVAEAAQQREQLGNRGWWRKGDGPGGALPPAGEQQSLRFNGVPGSGRSTGRSSSESSDGIYDDDAASEPCTARDGVGDGDRDRDGDEDGGGQTEGEELQYMDQSGNTYEDAGYGGGDEEAVDEDEAEGPAARTGEPAPSARANEPADTGGEPAVGSRPHTHTARAETEPTSLAPMAAQKAARPPLEPLDFGAMEPRANAAALPPLEPARPQAGLGQASPVSAAAAATAAAAAAAAAFAAALEEDEGRPAAIEDRGATLAARAGGARLRALHLQLELAQEQGKCACVIQRAVCLLRSWVHSLLAGAS
jgi:hypothetical protein